MTVLDLAARFWEKVDRNGSLPPHNPELGNCWVWKRARDDLGYGWFSIGAKMHRAHRVAWFLEHGRWPSPKALHKCDNPSCVRGSHLFEGTDEDNTADKMRKGRQARGEKHGAWSRGESNVRSKLSNADISEMRASYKRGEFLQSELSKRYGISQSLVSRILNKKAWKHLP